MATANLPHLRISQQTLNSLERDPRQNRTAAHGAGCSTHSEWWNYARRVAKLLEHLFAIDRVRTMYVPSSCERACCRRAAPDHRSHRRWRCAGRRLSPRSAAARRRDASSPIGHASLRRSTLLSQLLAFASGTIPVVSSYFTRAALQQTSAGLRRKELLHRYLPACCVALFDLLSPVERTPCRAYGNLPRPTSGRSVAASPMPITPAKVTASTLLTARFPASTGHRLRIDRPRATGLSA